MLLALLVSTAVHAQSPDEPWRVVQTEHFRVHYPVQAEVWAMDVASRVEAIHERVAAEVGPIPEKVVDIVVMDPYGEANGFALPKLGRPRMGVFPTPPGPESGIGLYRSWTEELVTHEDVHLVHLMRPSRNPWARLGTRLLGLGPVVLSSPAWVYEGYATMLEGSLTGSGRPHSPLRADLLRVLAREGRLPTFEQLNGANRWFGGSYPYLVGSAFLEWLAEREGPDAIDHLQARLTARKVRSFGEAFEGVFGEAPETLYARFRAEVSAEAIAVDRARPTHDTTLWVDLERTTGDPAVSSDGSLVALVERRKFGPPRLLVYPTTDDGAAAREWKADVDAILAEDPEDVAPLPPKVFPLDKTAARTHGGQAPEHLRWLPGGHTLLYTTWTRLGSGDWRPDLYTWDVDSHRQHRVTRHANVRDADPSPDGTWAVAVRSAWGASELVRVDLATGAVEGLLLDGLPDSRTVLDHPRLSPDGSRLLALRHRGAWELVVYDLASGTPTVLALPEGAFPSGPAWTPDGQAILISLGSAGFFEIWRVPLDGSPLRQVTRTPGGAFAPASMPDGLGVFFLGMDSEGMDLRRTDIGQVPLSVEPVLSVNPPVVPNPVGPAISEPEARPVEAQPYTWGRPMIRPLLGSSVGTRSGSLDAGLSLGDLIGRWNAEFMGSIGQDSSPSGGTAGLTWSGLPMTLEANAFGYAGDYGQPWTGLALAGIFHRSPDWTSYNLEGGAWGQMPLRSTFSNPSGAGWLGGDIAHRLWMGRAWVDLGGAGHAQAGWGGGGWIDPVVSPWMARGRAEMGVGWGIWGLGFGTAGGMAHSEVFSLGGLPTSFLPAAMEANRILVPALAPDVAQGDRTAEYRVEAGIPGALVLFGRRHQVSEGAVSLAGLEFDMVSPAMSLIGAPGLAFDTGVACVLESPSRGFGDRPCTKEGDWAAWVRLGYGPGVRAFDK